MHYLIGGLSSDEVPEDVLGTGIAPYHVGTDEPEMLIAPPAQLDLHP